MLKRTPVQQPVTPMSLSGMVHMDGAFLKQIRGFPEIGEPPVIIRHIGWLIFIEGFELTTGFYDGFYDDRWD